MPVKPKADWARIKAEFIAGEETTKEISERFGIGHPGTMSRCADEGWHALRRELKHKTSAIAIEDTARKRAADLIEFSSEDLKVARAVRALVGRELRRLADAQTVDARLLGALVAAAESAQRIGRLALGASTGNSEIHVKSLPASIDEFVIDDS